MEHWWKRIQGVLAGAGLLVLIFDSSLALDGAKAGVDLCIKTVIPSLFPFFLLSTVLTTSLSEFHFYPMQLCAAFLGIPKAAASLLIPAFLGGYPVGAKCIAELYQKQQISKTEAQRLMAFCNNAGPSFLFGMVSGFFPDSAMIWQLWAIHILSAVYTALLIPAEAPAKSRLPQEEKKQSPPAILSAAKAMVLVCCWVIFFRTILSFLNDWFLWLFPKWLQVLSTGILELSNGCCALELLPDVNLRFILCSCMIAFGGICVLLQTAAVTSGLSLGFYVKGKLLQTLFSLLLSYAVVQHHGLLLAAMLSAFIGFYRKIQNRSGNLRTLPV